MFVTSDESLYERVLTLSNHGRARGQVKQFWPDEIGFKYKMSNIQAAIGCAQIERIEELIVRKREILSAYKEKLSRLSGVTMNPEHEGTVNGAWMPTVVFDSAMGITREALQANFSRANVDARVVFWPLSSLPMFEAVPQNSRAIDIASRAINLPSYHDMREGDIERVVQVVVGTCAKYGHSE